MIEDMNSVFVKYASLMDYEPERPHNKFKWNDKKMVHWITPSEYRRDDWNEQDDEPDDFDDDEEKDEL